MTPVTEARTDFADERRSSSSSPASGSVRHLYVHLPFCSHRCGYCDFVTVVGQGESHAAYVDALLAELELERTLLAPELETVFLGGGTPTFTSPVELARLLAELPPAGEVTVEANPETVTPALARLLLEHGVTRVSVGAQTFDPALLAVLERRAHHDDVRRAVYHLRDAGFDNISLDLVYGIPGQSPSALNTDLEHALDLIPEHLSCYELEARPGTRFAHAHGRELGRQAEAMEGYFEEVVETLVSAGYRWYETANFCRREERPVPFPARRARGESQQPGRLGERKGGCSRNDDHRRARRSQRDLRSRHNLAYWRGRDYLGIGIGAVSTVGGLRWRNRPSLPGYLGALARGESPQRELEHLDPETKRFERLMLGLRLDEPLELEGVEPIVDPDALERLTSRGLVQQDGRGRLTLSRRGRFLGAAVTADLLAELPSDQPVPIGSAG